LRILHFADVHLDRPFVGLPERAAVQRRQELFEALRRCLTLAKEHSADAITVGGDLWEEEHVRADTRNSVAYELGQVGIPVLLICGNHDPLLPGGSYRRTEWPDNVQIFPRRTLSEIRVGDVSLWGVSWSGGELTSRVFETADVPRDRRKHLLLLHGSSTRVSVGELAGYLPFDPALVRTAGFDVCLAGHVHDASYVEGVVYPGSPEPLGWAETGRHCVALVDVADDVKVELVDVNRRRYERRDVDCSGSTSSSEIENRIRSALTDADAENVFLRIRLTGEVDPDCVIDPRTVARSAGSRYGLVMVEDATEPILDIESRAQRKGLDGVFARRLLADLKASTDDKERELIELALQAGLRALDNREVILRVD
jgi:exonuclease SbcD